MTAKEFEAIGRRLLPDLPGFRVKGTLLFLHPMHDILRGICFEGSDFDRKAFYATIFVLPLFVPTEFIHFSFGERLRIAGADRWNADEHDMLGKLARAIKQQALPLLLSVESHREFVNVAKKHPNPQDPYVQQAIAYTLARAGAVDQASRALDQLGRILDETIPWQREMAIRARVLKSQIIDDPAEAQKQLDAWEKETVRNLGLEEFQNAAR